MNGTGDLAELPDGWAWDGFAAPHLAWLGEEFLLNPKEDLLPPGCTDSTWILHAQFIRPPELGPAAEPEDSEDVPGFGFGAHPPEGWRRIKWADVASRKGVPLRGPTDDGREVPPCYRWSALLDESEDTFVVMPLSVHRGDSLWPTEGSLGKADLEALVPALSAHTTSSRMQGAFSPLGQPGPFESNRALAFDLPTMLTSMLATGQQEFTPEFWWPEDRAWVVWTDYDLMGSKVFGSNELIEAMSRILSSKL